MPKEGENLAYFQNFNKQLKAPYVSYADVDAIVEKKPHREQNKEESFTENTSRHVACGYAYNVVKSEGEAADTKLYRGENAVEEFLKPIFQEEEKIRKISEQSHPL